MSYLQNYDLKLIQLLYTVIRDWKPAAWVHCNATVKVLRNLNRLALLSSIGEAKGFGQPGKRPVEHVDQPGP